jgi:ADP-ribose pyrophosphatase YjhB (NUDIX family)
VGAGAVFVSAVCLMVGLRSVARMSSASEPALPVVPCVGAVVHDAAGRLLLIRRGHEPSRGLWSLPGGRVEPGETNEQAVEREVREETGLTVRAGAPVGQVTIPVADAVFDVVDIACTLVRPDEQPVPGDDADAVLFADAAALAELPCTPNLLPTLRDWGVLPA